MLFLLWLLAVILVLAGLYVIFVRKELILGIVLVVLGLLVGPGGVSIFDFDDDNDGAPAAVMADSL
jgi:hypothetical protein